MTMAASPALARLDVDAIYREFGERCYHKALRTVRDRDLAHDVVQTVFESLVRKPEAFDAARGIIFPWLMSVTHHKAVDLLRARHSRSRLDVTDQPLVDLPGIAPSPDVAACLSEDSAHVIEALRTLRAEEREILVLAYFGGYTQQEIAAKTGIALGTVKSRSATALRKMRIALEGSSV